MDTRKEHLWSDTSRLLFHVVATIYSALVRTYQEIFQAVKEEEHILLSTELLDFSFDNIVKRKSPNSKVLTSLLHEPKPAGLSRGGMVEGNYFTNARCPAGQ
jgi:hypothetical protein